MKNPFHARVALVGLGPIGLEVGRALCSRQGIEFLGAADPASDLSGKRLGDLLPVAGPGGAAMVDASDPQTHTSSCLHF